MLTPEEKRRRHRHERIVAAVVVLLLATITAALAIYSSRIGDELAEETTYVPTPTTITPEVVLLQEYIRFDTSNPPGNELPAAQWLAGIIRRAGVPAEVIESAPGRANVYARIEGTSDEGGLLLLHHIDVVPAPPEGWTLPPFEGQIRLDQLYGRGALDVKGPGIAFLRAFLDVAESGRRPKRDLVFLAVADEETGGKYGLGWLVKNRPEILDGIRYALNEGGITEMSQEEVTYYGVEIGTKVHLAMQLTAPTREQLQRARIALQPWFSPNRKAGRVLPEVREFFKDLAPQRIEFRTELADINRAISEGKFWRLAVGYRELTQNNTWAEAIVERPGGGYQMRTILANLPDENGRERIAWLESVVRPFGVEIGEIVNEEGPVPISSTDTPFYKLLLRKAEEAFDAPAGTEILNRSTNDSRFLRERGIDAYGINPFPVDFHQSESIHGVDERLRVAYFTAGVEFTRDLVRSWVLQ